MSLRLLVLGLVFGLNNLAHATECAAVAYGPDQMAEFQRIAKEGLAIQLREQVHFPAGTQIGLDPASFTYSDDFMSICGAVHYGGVFAAQIPRADGYCTRYYQVNYFRNVPLPFPQGAKVEMKYDGCG